MHILPLPKMSMPLHTKWTYFYDYQQKGKATQESWKDILKEVCTIEDVPTLLYVLENTGEADEWPLNSNIHFFREGIEPAWEDVRNINGGKWVLEIEKEKEDERINDLWKKTVAFCVSEQAKNEFVCGCVFSPRRYVDRLAVWTSIKDDDVMKIGRLWKENVGFEDQISFKVHENALKGVRNRDFDLYKL